MDINQPELNIGVIGSVGHGKTQLIKTLTGVNTVKFEKEKEQNITIKLGYANLKIYKDLDDEFTTSDEGTKLVKWASFVDCPGHDAYMSTMISGASIFDSVILLIAANEKCPMPQTVQHLRALQIMGNRIDKRNLVIVQNKLDLVTKEEAKLNYEDIQKFIKDTIMEGVPVIPICAIKALGIKNLLECIYNFKRKNNDEKISSIQIIRSFDVNKPGTKLNDIKGGVIGGTVINGSFKIGDKVLINPGISKGDKYIPIEAKILSLEFSPDVPTDSAFKGGLVGIGTNLDPSLTKSNKMVGQIIFLERDKNDEYKLFKNISFNYKLYDFDNGQNFEKGEEVIIHLGSNNVYGTIKKYDEKYIKIILKKPIFASNDDIISMSKKINTQWKMYAYSYDNLSSSNSSKSFEIQTNGGYEELLHSIYDLDVSVKKNIKKIPVPKITRTTTGISWNNFDETCTVLKRKNEHVSKYILCELGVKNHSFNKENSFLIKKVIKPQYIENILKKYILNYVRCNCCKNIETIVINDNGLEIMQCSLCHAQRTVEKL